jgi:hypothetical protein
MNMYLRHEGYTDGPLPADVVRARFLAGALSPRVMSFRTGEAGWESLGKRWGDRPPRYAWAAAAGWVLLLSGLGASLALMTQWFDTLPSLERTGARLRYAVWSTAAVTLLIALAIAATACWTRRRLTSNGLYALLVAALGVSTVAPFAHLAARTADHRLTQPNASVHASADGLEIHMKGPIGARAADDLVAALKANPRARRLRVQSEGGLVVDALVAARWIKDNRLSVRVDGYCASACMLLWAASPQREMSLGARLGLHRTYNGGDLPDRFANKGIADLERDSEALLKEAGFNDKLLEKRRLAGAEQMHWLTPAEALDEKVQLTVVDDKGETAAIEAIRWHSVINLLPEQAPERDLMLAATARMPSLVKTHAEKIYWATIYRNSGALSHETGRFVAAVRRESMRQTSDQAVLEWLRATQTMIKDAVQARDQSRCGALTGRFRWGVDDLKIAEQVNAERTRQLLPLVEAMAGQPASAQANPQATWRYGQLRNQTMQRAYLELARGRPSDMRLWDNLQMCSYLAVYFDQLARLPITDRAAVVRYSEAQY